MNQMSKASSKYIIPQGIKQINTTYIKNITHIHLFICWRDIAGYDIRLIYYNVINVRYVQYIYFNVYV